MVYLRSISDGGFMMLPITFCAIVVVALAGWTALPGPVSRSVPLRQSSRRGVLYRFTRCRSSRSRSSVNESGSETGSKQILSSQAW